MRISTTILAAAIAAAATACMLGPVDDERVATRDTPIGFNGFHLNPSNPVYIQAKNVATGKFETVREVRSGGSAGYVYGGTSLYGWNASVVLDSRYWRSGYRGGHAQVRTLWSRTHDDGGPVTEDEGAMLSVGRGWYSCYLDNPTAAGFRYNCADDESPAVDVYTTDYCGHRPNLQVSSVRVDYSIYRTTYDFVVNVSTGRSVNSIYVGGRNISCRLGDASNQYRCSTSTTSGPFSACELHDWLREDGRVVVRGWAGSGTCAGAASDSLNVEISSIGVCGSGSTAPPLEMDRRNVCKSEPTPSGWIIIDDQWDPTRCGEPTAITYNVKRIARYGSLPSGTRLEVCSGESVPAGWTSETTYWEPTRCGHPTSSSSRNVRRIRRL